MVDLVERLNALLTQETTVYRTYDYLSPEHKDKLQKAAGFDGGQSAFTPQGGASCASSSASSTTSKINEVWREKICEWSYQVADHFDFSREVVSVSISFLDRYLATRQVNKKLFQLVAMTTLYLAIKLYESGTLSMHSMIELSRGYFQVDQMAVMEMAILRSLSWHVHPPTPFCMSRHFLYMLPPNPSLGDAFRHDMLELARFLTELAVIDYFFVPKRRSSIGLAALLTAMETMNVSQLVPDFLNALQVLNNFDPYNSEILDCKNRLRALYGQGNYAAGPAVPVATATIAVGTDTEMRSDTVSPVCVSAFGRPTSSIKGCSTNSFESNNNIDSRGDFHHSSYINNQGFE